MVEPFSDHERHEIGAMLQLRESVQGPLCRPIGDWLVTMAKRTWPLFAGLSFFTPTNSKRAFLLASYHHPACLCWSWSIWITLFRNFHGKGRYRFFSSYRENWNVRLPFIIEVGWHRQRSDWMLSSNAQRRLEAVALYRPRPESEVALKLVTQ